MVTHAYPVGGLAVETEQWAWHHEDHSSCRETLEGAYIVLVIHHTSNDQEMIVAYEHPPRVYTNGILQWLHANNPKPLTTTYRLRFIAWGALTVPPTNVIGKRNYI